MNGEDQGIAKQGGLAGRTWYPAVSLYVKGDSVTLISAIQQQQQTSPTQMRMLDAQNLYSTPPMLYGAKEGQGFSTSPPHKSKLPKHTNKNHNSATYKHAFKAIF